MPPGKEKKLCADDEAEGGRSRSKRHRQNRPAASPCGRRQAEAEVDQEPSGRVREAALALHVLD